MMGFDTIEINLVSCTLSEKGGGLAVRSNFVPNSSMEHVLEGEVEILVQKFFTKRKYAF